MFCNVANKIEFYLEPQFVDVSVAMIYNRIQDGGIQNNRIQDCYHECLNNYD